jgi:short-subunit dehydrogenase
MSKIAGKIFIVTGSNKGIGRVIAEFLLHAGASVVLTGRNEERLETVRQEFEKMGFTPLAFPADLSLPGDCEKLVRATVDHFGRIDGLINNAGLPMRGRIENTGPGIFSEVLQCNLLSGVNCTRAALPELIRSRGHVVYISSIAAIYGLPNAAPYSVSKMGLERFAQSLRIEMKEHGIHVGVIRLGLVDAPTDKRVLKNDGSYQPVRRKGHQSQESAAKAVLRMLRRRRNKITMTLLGRATSTVYWFAPWLIRLVLFKTQYSEKYEA